MKLEDVARLAKVSKSAASIALNGKQGVSEETRARVLRVAKKYHYIPLRNHHKEAETEETLKIRFVACTNSDVVPDNYRQLPFFNELISYLTTEISNKKHLLITNNLPKDQLFVDLQKLEEQDPSDGIILLGTNLTSAHISASVKFKHLVILDTESTRTDCTTITMNNYLGAYDAAEHLIKMGHNKIGYIKGTPRINNFYDRRRGFKDALLKHGIDPLKLPKYYLPGMQIQGIETELEKLFSFTQRVTAIFCEDDYIAISMMKTLTKQGIRVPDDISIVGFDDIPESRATMPELTTVHVPIAAIAKEAIALIETSVASENFSRRQIFFNTTLIPRDSVKDIKSINS